MVRRIFLVLTAIVVLLIGSAFAIPYFFKDKILAAVKTAANDNVSAKVDFKDVSLSLFKHFPKVSVTLFNPDVTGVAEFDGVKLFAIQHRSYQQVYGYAKPLL